MTLDSINSIFLVISIILLFLTFAVGASALITSHKIAVREHSRLAKAEQGTAEANKKAAEATERAAKAAADAAAANERTVKLEFETAQQREKAAKAERELLEVKERIKPRQLSGTNHAALVAALRRANPKGVVTLICVLGDGEGFAFATQLDETLKVAGWPTNGVSQVVYGGGANPVGIAIVVHSSATAPPYAVALQRAFAEAGLPIVGVEQAGKSEGSVELLIGNKP
jgi:hypothetical protein